VNEAALKAAFFMRAMFVHLMAGVSLITISVVFIAFIRAGCIAFLVLTRR